MGAAISGKAQEDADAGNVAHCEACGEGAESGCPSVLPPPALPAHAAAQADVAEEQTTGRVCNRTAGEVPRAAEGRWQAQDEIEATRGEPCCPGMIEAAEATGEVQDETEATREERCSPGATGRYPSDREGTEQRQTAARAGMEEQRKRAEKEAFLAAFGQDYGYGGRIDALRREEFGRLGNQVYVDHAGATLYSERQLADVFQVFVPPGFPLQQPRMEGPFLQAPPPRGSSCGAPPPGGPDAFWGRRAPLTARYRSFWTKCDVEARMTSDLPRRA